MRERQKKSGLFYKVLLGILAALLLSFVYIRFGLLRPWLVRYEAAQPKHVSQEVFGDLFSPADWGRVYDLSGQEGDRESFVQAMEELTGGRELALVETYAGLSGDRRYIVKSGEESLAAFTLTSGGDTERETVWKLGGVELLVSPLGGTVQVRTLAGQRVLVDGRELDGAFQVRTTETVAERYLPEGVFGRRTVLWEAPVASVKGAQVTVLDGDGQEVPLRQEGEGSFAVEERAEEPTDQERAALTGAAKVHAQYMIRAADSAQLQRYFDSGSEIYRTIRSSEIWIKTTSGHSFSDEVVSEFCRYGEDMFSGRVSLHMDVRRGNGTSKPYEVDSTLFFHKKNGGWRAFEMTNMDVQREIVHARLVFMDGERELERQFVSSEDHSFATPQVTAPQGQRFAGWATREQKGNDVTMTVRFRPGEDGTVTLPPGYEPEPMTLYAVFEAE